jgi:hypothetical protein
MSTRKQQHAHVAYLVDKLKELLQTPEAAHAAADDDLGHRVVSPFGALFDVVEDSTDQLQASRLSKMDCICTQQVFVYAKSCDILLQERQGYRRW